MAPGTDAKLYPIQQTEWEWMPRPLRLAVAWVTIVAFSAAFYLVPAAVLLAALELACFGFWGGIPHVLGIVVFIIVLSFYPKMTEWPEARRFFQLWYEPFQFCCNLSPEVCKELAAKAKPGKGRYMIAMHPHGIVPLHACLWAAFCDQYLGPEVYGFGAIASVVKRMPIIRQVVGWLTCVPADYNTIRDGFLGDCPPANRAGRKPQNLYILPGGIAEVFTASPGRDIIICKTRTGLFRLSLVECKAQILPVYVFGANDFFYNLVNVSENANGSSSNGGGGGGGGLLSFASRRLRATITLFWGRFGLPIPYAPRVCMVIGKPLEIPSNENWGDSEIEHLRSAYIDEMKLIFNKYKAAAGRPNANLEVR